MRDSISSCSPLHQYSTSGALLQSMNLGGFGDVFGGEFAIGGQAVVPEPSSIVLLGLGAFALAACHLRRRYRVA